MRDPSGWIRHTIGGLAMIFGGFGVIALSGSFTGLAQTFVTGLGIMLVLFGFVALFS